MDDRIYMQPADVRKRFRCPENETFFVLVPNPSIRRRIRRTYIDYRRQTGDRPTVARMAATCLWLVAWDGETLPPPLA